MAKFTVAPVQEVTPNRNQRQPSQRSQVREQYQTALRDALSTDGQALVVEMDPTDKPLTIRNRIKRAADALGYTDITIRRRKNRIVAYRQNGGGSA